MFSAAKSAIRGAVRAFGFDIISYRRQDSLVSHLREALNLLDVNCVIDVGAHCGDYGSMLRDIGYKHRIVSFEPVKETYEHLARRASKDPLWRVERAALGIEDGIKSINVCDASNFSSFRSPNEYAKDQFGTMASVSRVEEVPVRRLESVLDDVVAGLDNPRIFLKIDTQGYDLEVLAGAGASISRLLGIQTEVSVKQIYDGTVGLCDTLTRLNGLGFEITGLYPVSRDRQLRVIEFDCVAVRSDGDGTTAHTAGTA